ncbi:hypothetical protein DIURU_003544 [Diutina rugosa]|uniref:serine--tRNA ligase n=1 Tax=Diutina rugosa TaxID=5481 RepID=A0A642USZ1_DIURU|nr:uncharacterized protein DIURU_003544 [Diutina rugosa]KAA8901174.1 hypothetical protein DIURU_003544 [Diutina rugosa]
MLCLRRYASKNTAVLKRAQLDLKGIVQNSEKFRDSLVRRTPGVAATEPIDFLINNRNRQLELSSQIDQLRKRRNELGTQMKASPSDSVKQELSEIKAQIKPLEAKFAELDAAMYTTAESLPNLLDPGVPEDPDNGDIVEFINCSSEEDAENSLPRTKYDHKDIAENLGIVDFKVASRISGSSWYYLLGDGALLEQALVQYALAKARKAGYTLVSPPSIVRNEVIHACGFKPKDQNGEKQVYDLADEQLSLTGTAEIPLGALHSSSAIDKPVKYAGVSRSYRAEAGARGRDTKGLYRVHEFTKVELFHFTTTPEKAQQELEELRQLQTEIITELGLKAKMINMPTTDLGAPAMKKYDCEAWMPGRGNWGELTSCSNCGDYQARRLGIKWINSENESNPAMTLNGTAMAVPRVIVAIIEQFYDEASQSVIIPAVLRPFMGIDRISKS